MYPEGEFKRTDREFAVDMDNPTKFAFALLFGTLGLCALGLPAIPGLDGKVGWSLVLISIIFAIVAWVFYRRTPPD